MADETRKVTAELEVTRTGDAGVFKETADDLRGMAEPASQAEESVGKFFATLEGAGAKAEDLAQMRGIMHDVASAVDELGRAKGVEQQIAALEKAQAAWRALGAAAGDSLKGADLKAYNAQLEEVERELTKLKAPAEAAFRDAEKAVGGFADAADRGLGSAARAAAQAKVSVEAYARALDDARARGENVGEAEAAQLEKLQTEYDAATAKVAEFKNAQADVREELRSTQAQTDLNGRSIGGLGDLAELASPKLAKMVGVAGAVYASFLAGYSAGEKLRNVLNELTDGAFDGFIQKAYAMNTAADLLVNGTQKLSDAISGVDRDAESLTNIQNVLRHNGIDPTTLSAEQQRKKFDELGKAHQAAAAEMGEAVKKQQEWAKELGASKGALDAQAKELAGFVAALAESNQQLSKTDIAALVKPQVQAILDAYGRLKVDVPPIFAEVAKAYGILTTAGEQAAAAHKQQIAAMVENLATLVGATKTSAAEIKKEQEDFALSLQGLVTKYGELTDEQLADLQPKIQELVDKVLAAGQQVQPELAEWANKLGVFVSAADTAGASVETMGGKISSATETFVLAGQAADTSKNSITDWHGEVQKVGEAASSSQNTISTWKGEVLEVGTAAGTAAKATKDQATAIEDAGTKAGTAGTKVADAAAKIGTSAEGMRSAATATGETASAQDKAATAISATARAQEEATTAVKSFSIELGAAGVAIETLTKIAGGLPEAIRNGFAGLSGVSTSVIAELGAIAGAFGQIATAAEDAATRANAALRSVATTAAEVAQQVQEATQVDGGGQASTGDGGGDGGTN